MTVQVLCEFWPIPRCTQLDGPEERLIRPVWCRLDQVLFAGPVRAIARVVRGLSGADRDMAPSHRDDDLPSCMSVFDVADGGGNLAQRESAVNHRCHLA